MTSTVTGYSACSLEALLRHLIVNLREIDPGARITPSHTHPVGGFMGGKSVTSVEITMDIDAARRLGDLLEEIART